MKQTSTPQRQNGSALIVALLITAIVAAIATAMMVHQRYDIRMTELSLNAERADLDSAGVLDWAIANLKQHLGNEGEELEIFPQIMPTINNFYGAQISGTLEDAMGLFNINSLVDPNQQTQFVRLIRAVAPNVTENAAFAIASRVTDWIRPSNADEIYLRRNPPYRAGHRRMVNISELRLVAGIDQKLYLVLAPYLTALPNSENKINIATAKIPVILSLGNDITVDQAKAMQACQKSALKESTPNQALLACMRRLNIQPDSNVSIVTSSKFFIVRAYVKIGTQTLQTESLLERFLDSKNNKVTSNVKVLWQNRF